MKIKNVLDDENKPNVPPKPSPQTLPLKSYDIGQTLS